jgi:hypothetical protein
MLTARTDVVVGLATAGPLELGLAMHHLYGFPILPASGLKGLAKASTGGAEPGRVYGEPEHAGDVAFLDGLPLEGWRVQPDVMTPHAPRWYRKEAPPDDTDNPVPIPFLSVAAGSRFEAALIARDTKGSDEALAAAIEDLRRGLEERGFGAKTAAGYGVFSLEVLAREDPGEDVASPPAPAAPAGPSPVAASLAQFISTLKLAEVRPQIGRVESDLRRCRPEERGPLVERFEVRLRALKLKEADVQSLMVRLRRAVETGEGDSA